MTASPVSSGEQVMIRSEVLQALLVALQDRGYQVMGPTVRDQAIAYDRLSSVTELPIGWTDEQDGGRYRLKRRGDDAFFGYVMGPHSWKRFLHAPVLRLWQARRREDGFEVVDGDRESSRYAFLGVRACELSAIAIQDQVFAGGEYVDPEYQERRRDLFLIAVNCGQAGGTCFCASMNTGPRVVSGHDLCLTEVLDGERHFFLVEIGTDAGAEIIADVPHQPPTEQAMHAVRRVVAQAAAQMGRSLDTSDIKELLVRNAAHPRWDVVARRCLTCTNCTMVCPTCFCTSVEDVTDLTGEQATRVRRWDSCHTMDFSQLHGGRIRFSTRARYRHWMTHKLATWYDQFGSSGCVGCGRCITWCPVGIDITEEARAIRESDMAACSDKETQGEDA